MSLNIKKNLKREILRIDVVITKILTTKVKLNYFYY